MKRGRWDLFILLGVVALIWLVLTLNNRQKEKSEVVEQGKVEMTPINSVPIPHVDLRLRSTKQAGPPVQIFREEEPSAIDVCSTINVIFTPKMLYLGGKKESGMGVSVWHHPHDDTKDNITINIVFEPRPGDKRTSWSDRSFWLKPLEEGAILTLEVSGCVDNWRFFTVQNSGLFTRSEDGSFDGFVNGIFQYVQKSQEDLLYLSVGGYPITIPVKELKYVEVYDDPIHWEYATDEYVVSIQESGTVSVSVRKDDDGNPLFTLPPDGEIALALGMYLWILK